MSGMPNKTGDLLFFDPDPQYSFDHIYGISYIIGMAFTPEILFGILADETRLRCLSLLHSEGELCVCEFTHALKLSQPKVSRHLAGLRSAGMVTAQHRGTWVYYRLHPDLPDWVRKILRITVTGIADTRPYKTDRTALAKMPNRPGSLCCA